MLFFKLENYVKQLQFNDFYITSSINHLLDNTDFSIKQRFLNGGNIASSECFYQFLSTEIVEVSFEITYVIAKERKPYNIDEILVKPHNIGEKIVYVKSSPGLMFRITYSKKMAKIHSWILQSKHSFMSSQKTLSVKFLKNYKLTFFQFNVLEKLILSNCCSY